MKNKLSILCMLIGSWALQSCSKSNTSSSVVKVNFIFKFDSTQQRLNNFGQPDAIPVGHAAQSPRFNTMSAHYLEFAPNAFTQLGTGDVLYKAPETTTGGSSAINFSKSKFAGNNQIFLSVPLDSVTPGTYEWLRVSLAYQNYNIYFNTKNPIPLTLDATVASFIGFNTYIGSYKVKDSTVTVNGNRLQGYWAVEGSYGGYGIVRSGAAPAGATTVPNPLFDSSPIPQGSCVVTGQFPSSLVITGNETSDINVVVSLSTNKSFEWKDLDGNGTFDPIPDSPSDTVVDSVVNMGIRGLIPTVQ